MMETRKRIISSTRNETKNYLYLETRTFHQNTAALTWRNNFSYSLHAEDDLLVAHVNKLSAVFGSVSEKGAQI